MTRKTNSGVSVEFVDGIVEAFNRHDVDAIVDYFADDAEWYLARGPEPCGRRLKGKEAIRDLLTRRYRRIPDMRWIDGRSWVSGNVAMSTWTVLGNAVDGEKIDWWGIDFWEFENGKIKKKDTYWKHVREED
jgi:ketosteroid isomerase-like protein